MLRPVLRARFTSRLLAFALLCALPLTAQIYGKRDDSLSQKEIDTLRETAYTPDLRVEAFAKFLDDRTHRIQDLLAKPRHAGRELDLHDLFSQVSDIADELNDNLDEYGPQHRDLRKALPKLTEAAERWQSTLRAAPPDDRYNVTRKLALAAVTDAHDAAEKLLPEQIAYFRDHPDEAKRQAKRSNHEVFDTDAPPPPK